MPSYYFDWYDVVSYFDRQARTRYPDSRYTKGVEGFNKQYDIRMSKAQNNELLYEMSGWPVIGGAIKASGRKRQINDYLANRGLTWADIEYPELIGQGSSVSGAAWNLSSNIYRLYR